jgi:hypothetical protein
MRLHSSSIQKKGCGFLLTPISILVMVQKQAKQVFGLGVACRLIRYRYRYRYQRRYRTDQPAIRQAPR